MTIGVKLGSVIDEIGTSDFFYAFFSTISGNLEPEGWGSRYPALMNKFYNGELKQEDSLEAIREIKAIKNSLAELPTKDLIWDLEDSNKKPPWADNISNDITDLSNYFVTSTGRDLICSLQEIFEELRDNGGTISIINC